MKIIFKCVIMRGRCMILGSNYMYLIYTAYEVLMVLLLNTQTGIYRLGLSVKHFFFFKSLQPQYETLGYLYPQQMQFVFSPSIIVLGSCIELENTNFGDFTVRTSPFHWLFGYQFSFILAGKGFLIRHLVTLLIDIPIRPYGSTS